MSQNEFNRRPRSNIVPGRRIIANLVYAEAGLSPENNSYQNISTVTTGDGSERNRSGRDISHTFANISLNANSNIPTPGSRTPPQRSQMSNRSRRSSMGPVSPPSAPRYSYMSPPRQARSRRSSIQMFGSASPMASPRSSSPMATPSPRQYPKRIRLPPVRYWLGERAIYDSIDGGFVRLTVVSKSSLDTMKRDEASMRRKLRRKGGGNRKRVPKVTGQKGVIKKKKKITMKGKKLVLKK